jgi:hypothetical protein
MATPTRLDSMWVDNLLTIDTKLREVSEKTEKLVLLDTQKYGKFKADAKKMQKLIKEYDQLYRRMCTQFSQMK